MRTDLGLACAGALYLGYRAQSPKELLAGAYDGAAFDPAGLSSRSSAVAMNFSAYLDAIEAWWPIGWRRFPRGHPREPVRAESL